MWSQTLLDYSMFLIQLINLPLNLQLAMEKYLFNFKIDIFMYCIPLINLPLNLQLAMEKYLFNFKIDIFMYCIKGRNFYSIHYCPLVTFD